MILLHMIDDMVVNNLVTIVYVSMSTRSLECEKTYSEPMIAVLVAGIMDAASMSTSTSTNAE